MIHRFRLFDTNIVLDVNSGAVHVFDDKAYEILGFYAEARRDKPHDMEQYLIEKTGNDKNTVREVLQEIFVLEQKDLLFSQDPYTEIAGNLRKNSKIKALCLHVSHDCNMRCRYCFASTGDFGTQRSLMSYETGKKAIDFVVKRSGNRRNIEVDFFGGEPMLNFDTVMNIAGYAKSLEKQYNKNFRFTITTNGSFLNEENMEIINNTFNNVVLSLDGRKATNDNMRVYADDSGTYEDILPNIKKMAQMRGRRDHFVRGTFTAFNTDFSKDVLHLAGLGFTQISLEPVVAPSKEPYSIKEEHLPALAAEYEKLAWEYVRLRKEKKSFSFFHFELDLEQGPCIIKRITGCGAGLEYIAVTPEGDIYPCHQFVGKEGFKMGNVYGQELDTGIQDMFDGSNIYTRHKCMDCWAKFYCSGGCAANAYNNNASLNQPYEIGCTLEKKRLECALWIKAMESFEETKGE